MEDGEAMTEPLICGGYILLSKKIIDSEVWKKPPIYLKVWVYLLSKAQWKEYKDLKRGQVRTSIPEIQEACSYSVGYRKEIPTYKQIRGVIDWLKGAQNDAYESLYEGQLEGTMKGIVKGNMIGTTKGTHGIVVTICNYNIYQDFKNYEGQDEGQDEEYSEGQDEIPTKEKERAEYKERIYKEKNNIYIDHFDVFWKSYPRKVGKAAAEKVFVKLKTTDVKLTSILTALENQKSSKQWQDKQFIPHPTTWLNQQRWTDEEDEQANGTELQEIEAGTFKF
jgi:hypothetical protein